MNTSLSSTASNVALPVSRTQPGPSSYVVWLGLMAWLVVVKLVITTFFPQAFADPAQAAFFGWLPLAVFAVLGLAGIWLADRTGFPGTFDQRVTGRQRILYPVLIGLLFSAVRIGFDLATGYSKFMAAEHGLTQQYTGLVPSLLIFPSASIIVEVVYRLFLIPLVLWLVAGLLLRNRGQEPLFWALAVLTSLIEPMSQELGALALGLPLFLTTFGISFGFNLTQATLFRKYGFLAAIVMRAAFYVVWHGLYIH